jgi:hypothetical protein
VDQAAGATDQRWRARQSSGGADGGEVAVRRKRERADVGGCFFSDKIESEVFCIIIGSASFVETEEIHVN